MSKKDEDVKDEDVMDDETINLSKDNEKSKGTKKADDAKESKTKEKKKKTSDKSVRKQNKVAKWFRDLRSEVKKVVWPSKKTVINNTTVVLVSVVLTSAFVGALDYGLMKLIDFLYNYGG